MADQKYFLKIIKSSLQILIAGILALFVLIFTLFLTIYFPRDKHPTNTSIASSETIISTVELEPSVLADDPNIKIIEANCTACHSAKLIVQNRATREGWKSMIVWMQKNQKLWDLGKNEDLILDYLAKNYAPEEKGRRSYLKEIEWYVLD
jgi:hypothetical protein